jgi:CheY-like chemotaxis protein
LTKTVLIADDHEEMRRLVVELLRGEGYETREASDGEAVLDEVVRATPDLLVLDVNMPGPSGVEALKTIRRNPDLAGMKVLLLSGSVDLASDWPRQVGADAHLPKPFPVDEFSSTVRELLAG